MTTAAAPSIKRRLSVDQDDVTKREGEGESQSFVRFLPARRAADAKAHHIIQLR